MSDAIRPARIVTRIIGFMPPGLQQSWLDADLTARDSLGVFLVTEHLNAMKNREVALPLAFVPPTRESEEDELDVLKQWQLDFSVRYMTSRRVHPLPDAAWPELLNRTFGGGDDGSTTAAASPDVVPPFQPSVWCWTYGPMAEWVEQQLADNAYVKVSKFPHRYLALEVMRTRRLKSISRMSLPTSIVLHMPSVAPDDAWAMAVQRATPRLKDPKQKVLLACAELQQKFVSRNVHVTWCDPAQNGGHVSSRGRGYGRGYRGRSRGSAGFNVSDKGWCERLRGRDGSESLVIHDDVCPYSTYEGSEAEYPRNATFISAPDGRPRLQIPDTRNTQFERLDLTAFRGATSFFGMGGPSAAEFIMPLDVTNYGFSRHDVTKSLDLSHLQHMEVLFGVSFCDELKALRLPYSLQTIATNAICACVNLVTIDLSAHTRLTSVDGISQLASLTELLLPPSLRSIGANGVTRCAQLTQIDLSACVSLTDVWGFGSCSALQTLVPPPNLRFLGERAFEGDALNRVNMSRAPVERIAGFVNCNLTEFTFPAALKHLGLRAFDCNVQLTQVDLSMTQLQNVCGFQTCIGLVKVLLPVTTVRIHEKAFWQCSALTEVNWGELHNLKHIDGFAENAFTTVVLPAAVETIGPIAFSRIATLKKVDASACVGLRRMEGFRECEGLGRASLLVSEAAVERLRPIPPHLMLPWHPIP